MNQPQDVSLVVIARNEEATIAGCLASVRGLVREIILVDDFSQDDTVRVARRAVEGWDLPLGLRVLPRRYDTPARQMNFGLGEIASAWALLLDCDERVSSAMAAAIPQLCQSPAEVAGVYFARRNIVFGRWLRHGGNFPDFNHARLVRRQRARFADHPVHPRMQLDGVGLYSLAPVMHHSYASLDDYFRKFNRYTSGEARAMKAAGRRFSHGRMWLESIGHAAQRGIRHAAFLDGPPGVIYWGLGIAYDVTRHLKLRELHRPRRLDDEYRA